MKTWQNAELAELSINATEEQAIGNSLDGGFIGDGELNGHLGWNTGNEITSWQDVVFGKDLSGSGSEALS